MTQITHTLHDQLAALKGKVKVKTVPAVEVRRAKTWRKRDEMPGNGPVRVGCAVRETPLGVLK
jgi:hypothetical protein